MCPDLLVKFEPLSSVRHLVEGLRGLCAVECGAECWEHYDYSALNDLARRCNQPDELLRWQDRVLVPFCQEVTAATLAHLAGQPAQPPLVLAAISAAERATADALTLVVNAALNSELAMDTILEAVASHPNLSAELADTLFVELDRAGRWARSEVFEALAANPATPAEVLAGLAVCARKAVRDLVADHPRARTDERLSVVVSMVERDHRYVVERARLQRDLDRHFDEGVLGVV